MIARARELGAVDALGWLLGLGALLAVLPMGIGLGLAGGALGLLLAGRRRGGLGPAACAAALLLGLGMGGLRVDALTADPLAPRLGSAIEGRVVVEEAWRGSGPSRIAIGRLLGPAGGSVLLRLEGAQPPRGSILAVSGRLAAPRAAGAEGGFDERAWLARQGVHAILRIGDADVVGERGGAWGVSDRLRRHALGALAPAGRGDVRQVVAGLAFGADAGLSPEAVEAFRASGLAHLLAVSGGNVALLVGLLVIVVWAGGGGRRLALGTALAAIPVYVAVVGPQPSVLRAGVAGSAACLAFLAGRPRDAWRALGLGFGLLLAWNPLSILDPGLQLSFASVAAILLVVPHARRIADRTPVPHVVAAAVLVSGAATLATAPIAWWHFERASVVASLPANLAAAPAVPLALWAALLAVAITPLAPAAGAGIAWLAQWPAAWILACARGGGWLAGIVPDWLALGLAGAVVLAIGARRRRVGSPHGRRPARPDLPAGGHRPGQGPPGGGAPARAVRR